MRIKLTVIALLFLLASGRLVVRSFNRNLNFDNANCGAGGRPGKSYDGKDR